MPAKLQVVGHGEHRPAQSNADEAGRNQNRRVVLVILASGDDDAVLEARVVDAAPEAPISPAPVEAAPAG